METSLSISIVALIFSLVAIIVSALLTLRQLRLMRHANLLPVLIDVFREFRSPTYRDNMEFIERRLRREYPPEDWSYDELPEPALAMVRPVAIFFHDVGILVANGIVEDTLASSYMGRSALQAWNYLEPYVMNARRKRGDPNLFLFFEHLVAIISRNPPDQLNKRLKLQTMSQIVSKES